MTIEQLSYLDDITEAHPVAYHERWVMACDRGVVLDVFVPAGPEAHRIAAGSAIVGLPVGDGTVRVYFEGDILNTGMQFADKMRHAAERMVCRYPTIACATLPESTLCQVGVYEVATHQLVVTERAYLTAWATRT